MICEYTCLRCGNRFKIDWRRNRYIKKFRICPECKGWAVHKQDCPSVIGTSSTGWPMVSESAGVSPEQVPAMQRQLAEKGVKCSFDSEGRPTFNSPTHRKQCLKAMGLVDKSGYN